MADEFVINRELTMEMMQLIAIKTFTALISKTPCMKTRWEEFALYSVVLIVLCSS